jgi:hypothetical protein
VKENNSAKSAGRFRFPARRAQQAGPRRSMTRRGRPLLEDEKCMTNKPPRRRRRALLCRRGRAPVRRSHRARRGARGRQARVRRVAVRMDHRASSTMHAICSSRRSLRSERPMRRRYHRRSIDVPTIRPMPSCAETTAQGPRSETTRRGGQNPGRSRRSSLLERRGRRAWRCPHSAEGDMRALNEMADFEPN